MQKNLTVQCQENSTETLSLDKLLFYKRNKITVLRISKIHGIPKKRIKQMYSSQNLPPYKAPYPKKNLLSYDSLINTYVSLLKRSTTSKRVQEIKRDFYDSKMYSDNILDRIWEEVCEQWLDYLDKLDNIRFGHKN